MPLLDRPAGFYGHGGERLAPQISHMAAWQERSSQLARGAAGLCVQAAVLAALLLVLLYPLCIEPAAASVATLDFLGRGESTQDPDQSTSTRPAPGL